MIFYIGITIIEVFRVAAQVTFGPASEKDENN